MRYFNYFKYTGENKKYKYIELYNSYEEELKWLKKYYYIILICSILEVVVFINMIVEKFNDNSVPMYPLIIISIFCVFMIFIAVKFYLSIKRLNKIVRKSSADEY